MNKIINTDNNAIRALAIESATKTASISILEDKRVISEFTLNGRLNHSETLLPMIDNAFSLLDFDAKDLDFIAVSKGPGSYTGLRIGISLAKGIARVAGANLVGVSTLEVLALNGRRDALICPMLDARRSHAYCAGYNFDNGLKCFIKPELRSVKEFTTIINDFKVKAHYLGDGSFSHRDIILENARGEYILGTDRENTPFSSLLGLLAFDKFKMGLSQNYKDFAPDYFRASQAKRMIQEKKTNGYKKI